MVKMVRVISQETYDELVKENIEELDMSPEEAIKESIAQLEAQGVDLSNIIKDLALSPGEEHAVSSAVTTLKDVWSRSEKKPEDILKELKILKTECNKDIARKIRAGKDGAYSLLLDILEYSLQQNNDSSDNVNTLTVPVLDSLFALMDMQPDLLDQRGVILIKRLLDDNTNEKILIATLRWASACCLKHEKNRQTIFATDIIKNLKQLLSEHKSYKLTSETLTLVRRLCLDDDVRVEYGKAHDHARELAIYTLDSLMQLLKEHTQPPLLPELMATVSALLVRDEFCRRAAEAGAGGVLRHALAEHAEHTRTVQQALNLTTALAGNDDVKRSLMKNDIAPLVISVINENMETPAITAMGLKCVSALALREPEHGRALLQLGTADVVAAAMTRHASDVAVQKNACWAIRNTVARCREENTRYLDLGVEELLNQALARYEREAGEDAKAALRDLECRVTLREPWTGSGKELRRD